MECLLNMRQGAVSYSGVLDSWESYMFFCLSLKVPGICMWVFFFFLMWTIFKISIAQHCFYSMPWSFGHKSCRTLVPPDHWLNLPPPAWKVKSQPLGHQRNPYMCDFKCASVPNLQEEISRLFTLVMIVVRSKWLILSFYRTWLFQSMKEARKGILSCSVPINTVYKPNPGDLLWC